MKCCVWSVRLLALNTAPLFTINTGSIYLIWWCRCAFLVNVLHFVPAEKFVQVFVAFEISCWFITKGYTYNAPIWTENAKFGYMLTLAEFLYIFNVTQTSEHNQDAVRNNSRTQPINSSQEQSNRESETFRNSVTLFLAIESVLAPPENIIMWINTLCSNTSSTYSCHYIYSTLNSISKNSSLWRVLVYKSNHGWFSIFIFLLLIDNLKI